jgi:hypothetical protein
MATELTVTWELEEGDWMDFAGDPAEEYREKFASGEWECFVAYVRDPKTGDILASLGGVILGRDSKEYQSEVEADLLKEAAHTKETLEIQRLIPVRALITARELLASLSKQATPPGNWYLERGVIDQAICHCLGLDYGRVKTEEFEAAVARVMGVA